MYAVQASLQTNFWSMVLFLISSIKVSILSPSPGTKQIGLV